MATRLQAPRGKVRVVGFDLLDRVYYLVGDFSSLKKAFKVLSKHNTQRGSMDDVYYVYDNAGRYICGNETGRRLIRKSIRT